MRAAPALAAMLACGALAGCLGSGAPVPEALEMPRLGSIPDFLLSQARFPMLPGEEHWVESHDGTMLHAVAWRPDAPEDWKAPVILVMSPYHGTGTRASDLDPASLPQGSTYRWLLETFVPRGYAVVLEDVRGTGESGGCLEQTGWKQQMDGYVSVEYFAAQPWSNAKVGMYGISYLGETQQGAAIHAPPHLATIVPAASVSDGYTWWFYDAVPYWDPWLGGMYGYMWDDGLQPPVTAPGLRSYPSRTGCHGENHREALGDGTHNAFWQQRDLRASVKNVQASVLYVHGLQDWNVKPDNIVGWFNELEVPKQAWLGQWEHNYPWRNSFNSAWSRADWNATVHRWFDHWLLGMENGVMGLPTVQVQDSQGVWRAEQDWPPTDARPYPLHLDARRNLTASPPADDGLLAWDEQRERAAPRTIASVPLTVGFTPDWLPAAGGMSPPFGAPEAMPDGLRFEALAPLAADLRVAGEPRVTLTVASSEPETHLAVHLLSIAANGTETIWDRGYLSAAHRLDLARVEPLVPGQPTELTITMYPQDFVVPAGERLALWIGPWDDWARPEGNDARVELHLGPGAANVLSLPVIERDLARVGLDAPMWDWRAPG